MAFDFGGRKKIEDEITRIEREMHDNRDKDWVNDADAVTEFHARKKRREELLDILDKQDEYKEDLETRDAADNNRGKGRGVPTDSLKPTTPEAKIQDVRNEFFFAQAKGASTADAMAQAGAMAKSYGIDVSNVLWTGPAGGGNASGAGVVVPVWDPTIQERMRNRSEFRAAVDEIPMQQFGGQQGIRISEVDDVSEDGETLVEGGTPSASDPNVAALYAKPGYPSSKIIDLTQAQIMDQMDPFGMIVNRLVINRLGAQIAKTCVIGPDGSSAEGIGAAEDPSGMAGGYGIGSKVITAAAKDEVTSTEVENTFIAAGDEYDDSETAVFVVNRSTYFDWLRLPAWNLADTATSRDSETRLIQFRPGENRPFVGYNRVLRDRYMPSYGASRTIALFGDPKTYKLYIHVPSMVVRTLVTGDREASGNVGFVAVGRIAARPGLYEGMVALRMPA